MIKPHTRIPKEEHDLAVAVAGSTGLAIFVAILRIQSDSIEEKEFFPAGAARIARLAGCSMSTAKRIVPKLAAAGLIAVTSGKRVEGTPRQEENKIQILCKPDSEGAGRSTMNQGGRFTMNQGDGSTTTQGVGSPRHGFKGPKGPYKKERENPRFARRASGGAPAGEEEEDYRWDYFD